MKQLFLTSSFAKVADKVEELPEIP